MSDRAEAKKQGENSGQVGSLEAELKVVENGFLWFAHEVDDKLDELRRHATTPEQSTWNEKAADGLLSVALEVGAAMTGQWLAAKVARSFIATLAEDAAKDTARDAIVEKAKGLFEKGTKVGLSAAKSLMASTPDVEAVHRFIDGQKRGVRASLQDSQNHFIRDTRSQITSRTQAGALAKACERESLSEAAELQYAISRDAYVAFLAQSKYGTARTAPDAAVTTNMTNQATRDKANGHTALEIPFYRPERAVPPEAPELNDAVFGKAPGILSVVANLPVMIGDRQVGKPSVSVAILNGVPRAVASQYEGKTLAELKIPRQVNARVPPGTFVLNIDEAGSLQASDPKGLAWLRANGERVAGTNDEKSARASLQRGLADLLDALHVNSITKSGVGR